MSDDIAWAPSLAETGGPQWSTTYKQPPEEPSAGGLVLPLALTRWRSSPPSGFLRGEPCQRVAPGGGGRAPTFPSKNRSGANCSKAETALDAAQDAHSARRSREQVSARRGRAEGNGWRLQSTPRGAASHARAAPASTIGTRRHSLTISAEAPPPRLPG
jgi:hypothetical protein